MAVAMLGQRRGMTNTEPTPEEHLSDCQECRTFVTHHSEETNNRTGGIVASPVAPAGRPQSLPDHLAHCDVCSERVVQHRDAAT
jgi:hypothetical protein